MAVRSDFVSSWGRVFAALLALGSLHCADREAVRPVPFSPRPVSLAPPAQAAAWDASPPAPKPPASAQFAAPSLAASEAGVVSAQAEDAPGAPYVGVHKLGVNRVTDMARIGQVSFSREAGALRLRGRVARGLHWLELAGVVEPHGPGAFTLIGVLKGVPDMAWADEPLRERKTEGRFKFELRKGRPYFRLYEVNGSPCVCDDECGNDFCYIDIETANAQGSDVRR